MKTVKELAEVTDPVLVRLRGMVRRMAISLTSKALWQLTGFRQLDGSTETQTVEPFSGIGFYARPPTNGKPEAIVNMVGDANSPAIVATRDEKTRAAVAGAIAADETAVFNSQAMVYVKADGTIEARSAGGTAAELATKADLDALRTAFLAWVPVGMDGGAALKTLLTSLIGASPPYHWPTGTTKLKGE